ncbi:MAG: molecular chaperone DnaJ [Atopobiaceae bacterium]|nr:molecular chaperone DnaJ [Atopobiaceae bacterium]
MDQKRDYYEVLGVERDADEKTIKRAFLKKARSLHPDVNKEAGAEEAFKEVNEAYSVLSDERKRANYDRYGTPDGPGGFGSDYVDMSDIFGGSGFGFSDIFDSFFGGAAAGGGRAARTRGRDMGITLRITLEEAAAGCTKTVAYDRLAPCDDCNGSGTAEGGHEQVCSRCGGSGRVVEVQRTIFGSMQTQSTCPECGGTGHVIDKPCETCGGQGRTPSRETVQVTVPQGVHAGQTLTVEGKGEAGVRGDRGGDLVVRIDIVAHDVFQRQGDDLYCQVSIDSFAAILGTTVPVTGIMADEQVSIDIPAGCQYGQQVVVEGAGMPRLGGTTRGNLVAVVEVGTPTGLSQERISKLRELLGDDAPAASDVGQGDKKTAGKAWHFRGRKK